MTCPDRRSLSDLACIALAACLLAIPNASADEPKAKTLANLDTHQLPSPHQANKTTLRVLLPDDYDSEKRYRTLYVLPVHEDGFKEGTEKHGDGLAEIGKHDFHNAHQLICVAPSFTSKPWYADHDANPKKHDESHLLKTVIPFIEAKYPVNREAKGRLLLGFSKSGWGALTLLLRNPDTFYRAAAWDVGIRVDTGPIEEAERDERIARNFGTPKNFAAYRLSALIKTRGKMLGEEERILYYNTEGRRSLGGEKIHQLLEAHDIPHRYVMEPHRPHTWGSGWIPRAIEFLLEQ